MKEKSANKQSKVVFKPYVQNQVWLLPPSLGELIPPDHPVRLVNDAVDKLALDSLLSTYKGGGSSSYHPRMLLKALIYGYIEKIYSSRGIEKALKENICFMWLSGMQQPDHGTLNNFRKHRMKQTVKEVFAQILLQLIDQGYVKLQDYYIDGTKIESVANRYSFVWAKNVDRYKAGLLNKIAVLLDQIDQANDQADQIVEDKSQDQALACAQVKSSEDLIQTIEGLHTQLKDQLAEKKELKKKMQLLEQEYLSKLKAYEQQEALLAGRSSYSKTDPDASFMRTKDDHLNKGQLKPCYNVQLGTSSQFIINYTVHQSASDMAVFTQHMDSTMDLLEAIEVAAPKRVGADAGYGSEQNYGYLDQRDIAAYLKYPGYYKERKKTTTKTPFYWTSLYYNETQDYFVCPMGQQMHKVGNKTRITATGYIQQLSIYQACNCRACPIRGRCHKGAGNREIAISHKARIYRKQARQRLCSLRGIRMRKQRNVDVEACFGHIKYNRGFRRFTLCSLQGVSLEMGLIAIAHNLKKCWAMRPNKPTNRPNKPIRPILTPLKSKTTFLRAA